MLGSDLGWIGNFCFICGAILIARKDIRAYIFQIMGNIVYLFAGLLWSQSSVFGISVLLMTINICGFINWRKANAGIRGFNC